MTPTAPTAPTAPASPLKAARALLGRLLGRPASHPLHALARVHRAVLERTR